MAGLRITLRGCHKKRRRPLPPGRLRRNAMSCAAVGLVWDLRGTMPACRSLSRARVIAADALVSHFVRSCCAAATRPEGESSWRELAFEHTAQQRPISKMSAVPDQPLAIFWAARSSLPRHRAQRHGAAQRPRGERSRWATHDRRPFAILSSGALRVPKALELKRSFVFPAALPSAHGTAGA